MMLSKVALLSAAFVQSVVGFGALSEVVAGQYSASLQYPWVMVVLGFGTAYLNEHARRWVVDEATHRLMFFNSCIHLVMAVGSFITAVLGLDAGSRVTGIADLGYAGICIGIALVNGHALLDPEKHAAEA